MNIPLSTIEPFGFIGVPIFTNLFPDFDETWKRIQDTIEFVSKQEDVEDLSAEEMSAYIKRTILIHYSIDGVAQVDIAIVRAHNRNIGLMIWVRSPNPPFKWYMTTCDAPDQNPPSAYLNYV